MKSPRDPLQVSAAATGGAGHIFEQRSAAYFLGLLLARAVPPHYPNTVVSEVQLQTRNIGWWTDDILVTAQDGTGRKHKQAMQCKLGLRISTKDEECRAVIVGAWKDFRNEALFDKEDDSVAIVLQRGTDVIVRHFCALLERSRTCRSAEVFVGNVQRRIGLTQKTCDQYAVIRSIIEEDEKHSVDEEQLWKFLRCLKVLILDFDSCGQTMSAIRTVLAATASAKEDAVRQATTTWDALCNVASDGMCHGALYRREDLPEPTRNAHGQTLDQARSAIVRLQNHGTPVLERVRSVLGKDTHIDRSYLVGQIIEKMRTSHVVVVAGPAGSGKSVMAREAVRTVEKEAYVFAFRAEEFAKAHVDQTLSSAQIGLQAKELLDVLKSHDRKVVLIESVERLLEKGQREALGDLLHLIQEDSSWHVLMTCREYSLDVFCKAFLADTRLTVAVVQVPLLTDSELRQVAEEIPALRRPLSHKRLAKLLQNPYLLAMAARMTWSEPHALPNDERSFRQAVWNEIVKKEAESERTLSGRRGHVFQELALRRARALSPFAACGDLDREALDALFSDELIEFSKDSDSLAAPAHDVLEDWAILQWLDGRFAFHEGEHPAFLAEIGMHPAMRRGYRQWLGAFIAMEAKRATSFAFAVAVDVNMTKQIRDDTLVSILLSDHGPAFLEQSENRLVADDFELLMRTVHLLRVACMRPPSWLSGVEGAYLEAFLTPHGPSWVKTLTLIAKRSGELVDKNALVVLGFVRDWARLVTLEEPYPEGVDHAAVICSSLLARFEMAGHMADETLRQVIELICKIPKACEKDFLRLMKDAASEKHLGSLGTMFRELILEDMNTVFACRDFPQEVMALAESQWKPRKARHDRGFSSAFGLVEIFGLSDRADHLYVPPSAWQGPFLCLLRHRPKLGVQWIVDLLNRAVASYAADKSGKIEPPWEVKLEIDGVVTKQWANERLWLIYRGSSVAPSVLQCSLMALEAWLLERCEQGEDMAPVLQWILKASNNVATTAVVASVAMAHPEVCGAWVLPLLRCRELFGLDLARMVADYSPTNAMVNRIIPVLPARRLYTQERDKSDSLPHREQHLEHLAIRLQLGSLREAVQAIIDKHKAGLSPVHEQDEKDKVWRLALHRR
jgi:hypothetical protein